MTHEGLDIISSEQFKKLVETQLFLNQTDIVKLIRVAGFTGKAPINQAIVVKNFNDRLEQSAKIRNDCI